MVSTFGFLAVLMVFGYAKVIDQKMIFVPIMLLLAFVVANLITMNRRGRRWAGLKDPWPSLSTRVIIGAVATLVFVFYGIKTEPPVKSATIKPTPPLHLGK